MARLYDKKITVTYSGISLECCDYSFRLSDRFYETVFTNGTIKTSVAGKSVSSITVRGRMPSGKTGQFVTLFSPLIGTGGKMLMLDGFSVSAFLDSFELSPSETGGLTDFTLIFH